MAVDTSIQVTHPPYDDNFYRARSNEAIMQYLRKRDTSTHKQMLDVIAGLCRLAYMKGRNDGKGS